ncbi:MAG: DUF4286 family protein [Muribaculaceae bacterium]|nr:DUF4286 family protein [Muribaculaceae bacterium]
MIIYNCTFMLDKALGQDFLRWLKEEALTPLTQGLTHPDPRLTRLIDVPGDPEFNNHALSYALQLEFDTLAEAQRWARTVLQSVTGMYTARFGGEKALLFTTILQDIPLR